MFTRQGKFHSIFSSIDQTTKRILLLSADLVAVCVSLWAAFALRLSEWWPSQYIDPAMPLFAVIALAMVLVYIRLGLYRAVIRFMNTRLLKTMAMAVGILALVLYMAASVLSIEPFPRSVPIIFALAFWSYVGASRLLIRSYYQWLINDVAKREPVLIYGAGQAGAQLARVCQVGSDYLPIAFVDDAPSLRKAMVADLNVFPTSALEVLIDQHNISTIIVTIAEHSSETLRDVYTKLNQYSLAIKVLPDTTKIFSSFDAVQLENVDVEDLLGRDAVSPDPALIEMSLKDKNVCVTGAGGSIGSELAKQAVMHGAAVVVLYENSETALYNIERSLLAMGSSTKIVAILGSVLDEQRVANVLSEFAIQTVYHAAAFKHVPIVEHNVIQGVLNNSVGSAVVAECAVKAGVERLIFISTDKAVRPTNVMGASKRLAEMQLQVFAEGSDGTIISMVRFGNVLGSSGSVIPLFKEQIAKGGPLTVTHPEITRYFMTIPEAASLVIQAGSLAEGGEVFLLDMGKPVKIADLAAQLIHLSGANVKSDEHPEGIEIVYSGLRPGEKLYEELLIGEKSSKTSHPKIFAAHEECLSKAELDKYMQQMHDAIAEQNAERVRELLVQIVKGYVPAQHNVDLIGSKPKSVVKSPGSLH